MILKMDIIVVFVPSKSIFGGILGSLDEKILLDLVLKRMDSDIWGGGGGGVCFIEKSYLCQVEVFLRQKERSDSLYEKVLLYLVLK